MIGPISPVMNTAFSPSVNAPVNPNQPHQPINPMNPVNPIEKEQFKIGVSDINDPKEAACTTCAERRYKDVSSDSGVSFQTPTHISPEQSFSQVRAHEHEHLNRNRAKAHAEGKEVVAQSVTYRISNCTECGKTYKAGGKATTVTKTEAEKEEARTSNHWEEGSGRHVDKYI